MLVFKYHGMQVNLGCIDVNSFNPNNKLIYRFLLTLRQLHKLYSLEC